MKRWIAFYAAVFVVLVLAIVLGGMIIALIPYGLPPVPTYCTGAVLG